MSTDGYSVQLCRATGALLLVAGDRTVPGYDLVAWTAGRRADGEQALAEVKARICGQKLPRGVRMWCRLATGHPGACQ
jgi:hypothetical protein